ncbi:MAG: hypothetical protein P8R54_13795 [Myxococcota bacterium]|nr:hypothetical protein [Myxococcota bacterium]
MILWLLSCGIDCPEGSALGVDGLCYLDDEMDTVPADTPPADAIPTLSAAAVGEQIAVLAGRAIPDPIALRERYLDLLHAGDASCPGESVDYIADGSIPLEGCTSSTGYTYRGLSEYEEGNDNGWWFALTLGDLYISEPDGASLAIGGTFAYEAHVEDGAATFSGEATGTFSDDGTDGWLAEGGSLAFWLSGTSGSSGRGVALVGAIGGPLVGSGLFFEDLYFGDVAGPDGQLACGSHPSGGLSLRGDDGRWYELVFTDCSGCGRVVFEGQDLGETCADITAMGAEILQRVDPL